MRVRVCAWPVGAVTNTNCLTGTTGLVKSANYDAIGNLTNKSDLAGSESGNLTYPTPGGGAGSRPHAVTAIAGVVNGITDPRFVYDPNGNMLCEYTGANCVGTGIIRDTESYWASNMTKRISQGTTNVQFVYDSEHARITMAETNGSSTVTKTYLNDPITGAMSEVSSSGGTPTWTDYLMADGKLLGQRSCTGATPCAAGATTEYFILDHLGSVSVVTDGATGAVTARESFDAWGKQRNPDASDDPTCSTGPASPNKRRFTSQEHIDEMCLINLNARIYDPIIGRFMAADSMVPDPTDGQSYNRYTYTDNRPLSFTDTSGHLAGDPEGCILCTTYNPGSQQSATDSDAHPEMEVAYQAPPSSFAASAGAAIKSNTDGEQAVVNDQDGNGAVGVDRGAGLNASDSSLTANENALSSDAASNARPTGMSSSSGDGSPIETVVVTGERKPSVVNGYNVIIIDTRMPGPGENHAVIFQLDHPSPNGGAMVQHVKSYVRNPDGSTRRPKDFSEEWPVSPGHTRTDRSIDKGQDDQYGVLNSGGATGEFVVHGEVQYHDGVDLRAPEWKVGNERDSGQIPSKQGAPGLPQDNATPPTIRNVEIPF